eukprot:tig00000217_g19170.t1
MEPAVQSDLRLPDDATTQDATTLNSLEGDAAQSSPRLQTESVDDADSDASEKELRRSIARHISANQLAKLEDVMRSGARADFTVEGDQEASPVLLFALRKANLDAARTLLFGKPDGDVGDPLRCKLDATDARGITALMYACASGLYEFAELLVALGANLALKDHEGQNALFHAFINRKGEDSLAFFKRLCTKAALLRVPDPDDEVPVDKLLLDHAERNRRMTVLMLASAAGAYAYAEVLVWKGANVHARDGNGESAPFHALNSQDHFEKLLELFYTPDGYLRLHQRDRKGVDKLLPMMEVEEELRPAKWPVMHIKYALNDNYQSLLSYAVRNRKVDQARMLLDRYQLDPDFHDRDGRTPLVYAAQNANEHGLMLVRMLLQPDTYREKVPAKDDDGVPILEKDGTPKMVDEVKTRWKTADTKKRDFFGVTALQVALENQNIACARELLGGGGEGGPTAGIDPAMQDILRTIVYPGGKTPLMNCVGKEGALGLTKELLNARVDVNARDVNGRTALMYVAVRGDLEDQNYEESRTTRSLVNASVKVYDRDCDGRTALHFAAFNMVKRQEFKGAEFLTTRIDVIKELVTTARDLPGVLDDSDRPPLTYAIFCRPGRGRPALPDYAAMAAAVTEARGAAKAEEAASQRALPAAEGSLEAIAAELHARHPEGRLARRSSSVAKVASIPDRVLLSRAGFDVEALPADFDAAKALRAADEERARVRWMMERGIALLLHLDLTRVKRADGSVDPKADVRGAMQWTVDFRDAVGLSPLMWAAFTDFADPAVYGRECLDLLLLCSKNADMKRFLDAPREHEIELDEEKQPTFQPGEPEFLGLVEYFASFDPIVNYRKIVRVCRLPVHCALLFSRAFRERANQDEVRNAEFSELADQAVELAFELLDEKYQEPDFHDKLRDFFEAPHIVSLEHKRLLAERRAAYSAQHGASACDDMFSGPAASSREDEKSGLLPSSLTSSGRGGPASPRPGAVRMPAPKRESLIDIAQSIGSRAGKWMAHPATKAYLRVKWAGEMAPGESTLGFVFLRPFDGILTQSAYYAEERYNVFEGSVPNRPASFFATARGKFAMEFLFYLSFIVFYTLAINNQTVHMNLYDLLLGIMVAGFVAAEGGQLIEERFEYFKSPWNLSDVTMMGIFLAYYLLRTYAQIHPGWSSADWNVMAYRVLAPNAILLWTRLLNTCDLHPDLGPLLVIIKGMMTDFFVFIVVLALVLLGFAQTIHVFMEPILSPDNNLALSDSIIMMFRAVLGGDFYEQVQEAFPAWGPLFYFVFVILTTVMLLNLLIALFGGTYGRITDNAQNEFQFGRATTYLSFVQRDYVPPPFNLVAKAFSIVGALPVFCFGRSCRAGACERLGNRVASIAFLFCLAPFAVVLYIPVTVYERLAGEKARALEDEEAAGGAREGAAADTDAEEDDFTIVLYEGEGEEEGEEGWQQVHRLNRTMQREVRNSLGLIEARLTGLERRVEASKDPQKSHARPALAAPRIANDGTLLGPLEPPEPPPPEPTEHEIVLGELAKLQGNLDAFVASLSQRSEGEMEDVRRQVQRASQMDVILDKKLAALTEAVTALLARGEHHADTALAAARAAIERRVEDRVAGVEATLAQQGAELAQASGALGVKINGVELRLQQRMQEVATVLDGHLHERTRSLEASLTRHLSAILASITGTSILPDSGLEASAQLPKSTATTGITAADPPSVELELAAAAAGVRTLPEVKKPPAEAAKAETASGKTGSKRKASAGIPVATSASTEPPAAVPRALSRAVSAASGTGATLEERLTAQISLIAAHVASVEEDTRANVRETRRVLEDRLASLAATLTGGAEEEHAQESPPPAAAGSTAAATVVGKWKAAVGTSTLEDRLAKKILLVAQTVAKNDEQMKQQVAETTRTLEKRLTELASTLTGSISETKQAISETKQETEKRLSTTSSGMEKKTQALQESMSAATSGLESKVAMATSTLEQRLSQQIVAVAQSIAKTEEQMKQQVAETTRTIEGRLTELASTLTGSISETKQAISETKQETEKRLSTTSSGMEKKTQALQESMSAATSGLESKVAMATSTLEQRLSQQIVAVAQSIAKTEEQMKQQVAETTRTIEGRLTELASTLTGSISETKQAISETKQETEKRLSTTSSGMEKKTQALQESMSAATSGLESKVAMATSTLEQRLSQQIVAVAQSIAKTEEQLKQQVTETTRTIEGRLTELASTLTGSISETKQAISETKQETEKRLSTTSSGMEKKTQALQESMSAATSGLESKVAMATSTLEQRLSQQIVAVAQSVAKTEEQMKQQVTETTRAIEKRLTELAFALTGSISETKQAISESKQETEKRLSTSSSGMEKKTQALQESMSAATSTLEQRLSQAIAAVASSVQDATSTLNTAVSRLDAESQRRLADTTRDMESRISKQLEGVIASLARGEATQQTRIAAVQEALTREVRAVQDALADHARAVADATARGADAADARISSVQEGLSVQLAGVAGQLAQHAQAVAASLARGDAETAGMVEQLSGLASMVREQAVHLDFLRDRVEQIAKLQSTLDDYWVAHPSGASQRTGAPGSHVSPQTITALMSSISTSLADVKAQIALKRASTLPPSSTPHTDA